MDGPLGYLKRGVGMILAHVALVLWPCALFLIRNLFQQKRWQEQLKTFLLIALSLWFASRSTLRVYAIWTAAIKWLTR